MCTRKTWYLYISIINHDMFENPEFGHQVFNYITNYK